MIDRIIYLFTVENKSLRQIGLDVGIPHIKVRNILQSFGYETPTKRLKKLISNCICKNCGKEFIRYSGILNKETFCSHECYNIYRDNHRSSSCTRQLTNRTFLALRKETLKKFPECVLCGSKKNLHIHHIFTRRENEDLCYIINNLITLCRSCHCMIKGKEMLYANYFLGLVEKCGELLETPNVNDEGNQQPNSLNAIEVGEKVQRLMGEDATNKPNTSAAPEREDIVRAIEKSIEVVA
jgi:hypothetical protein